MIDWPSTRQAWPALATKAAVTVVSSPLVLSSTVPGRSAAISWASANAASSWPGSNATWAVKGKSDTGGPLLTGIEPTRTPGRSAVASSMRSA